MAALSLLYSAFGVEALSTIGEAQGFSRNLYFYATYVRITVGDSDAILDSIPCLMSAGGWEMARIYVPDADGKPGAVLGQTAIGAASWDAMGRPVLEMAPPLRLFARTSYLVCFSSNGASSMVTTNYMGDWSGLPGWSVAPINKTHFDGTEWWDEEGTYPMFALNVTLVPTVRRYADWAAASFTAEELAKSAVSGAAADPDGAGLPNLLRYAFRLPARGPVAAPVTQLIDHTDGRPALAVKFNRAAVGDDLVYTVEAGDSLNNWTTVATLSAGTPTEQTVRDSTLLTGATRRFMRVRVSLKP